MKAYRDPKTAREIIMAHYAHPDFKHKKFEGNVYKEYKGNFACCSDDLLFYVKINNGVIEDIFFDGVGCSIVVSATDLLLKYVIKQPFKKIREVLYDFKSMLTDNTNTLDGHELSVFHDVVKHQNRVKCAIMPANVIEEMLIPQTH